MAEDDSHNFIHPSPQSLSPMKHRDTSDSANGGCGEIVEVQGGHIVRSTGRKDRHSKVCTAKGPRDRRVRLAAHTAIQFYDVQDRLGFDRPSKAVDWLIKKAKTSIDELDELPPWNPADAIRNAAANAKPRRTTKPQISPSPPPPPQQQNQHQQLQFGGSRFDGGGNNESSFLPPSMDSDSIADTIKSFFPVAGSSTEAPTNQLMHNYHHHHHHQHHNHPPDLLSRTNSQNQDLRLSLQSFPDGPPSLLHNHHSVSASSVAEPVMFYGQGNQLGFDNSMVGWEQQSSEFGRIQRLAAWNSGGVNVTGNGGGGGFVFAPPLPPPSTASFQPILGQSQVFSQRGPLQSSYTTPMIRAWYDPHHHPSISTDVINHHHHQQQSAIPGIGFAPGGEFSSGFRVPARFQGPEEEHHDGLTNKPSSASSIFRH